MSHEFEFDFSLTSVYTPNISLEPNTPGNHVRGFNNLENRHFHEGRIVDTSLQFEEGINTSFRAIGLECLLEINEKICPRFIMEFFRQVELVRNEDRSLSLWFYIKNQKFTLSLGHFAHILRIPNHGQCAFTEDWSLDSLFNFREENSPYSSHIPSPEDLHRMICKPRPYYSDPNIIFTRDIREEYKPLALILRENVWSLRGNREILPACCAHMLYCLLTQQPYNLAYFFARRIANLQGSKNKLIPYGMFLTRLYHNVMHFHPQFQSPLYVLVNKMMEPLNISLMKTFFILDSTNTHHQRDDPPSENTQGT